MADNEVKLMQWDGKIGPSAVIGLVQLVFILIGGVITVAQLQNGIENQKQAVQELKNVVTTIQASQAAENERVSKVETSLGFVVNTVQRLESKIDEKRR